MPDTSRATLRSMARSDGGISVSDTTSSTLRPSRKAPARVRQPEPEQPVEAVAQARGVVGVEHLGGRCVVEAPERRQRVEPTDSAAQRAIFTTGSTAGQLEVDGVGVRGEHPQPRREAGPHRRRVLQHGWPRRIAALDGRQAVPRPQRIRRRCPRPPGPPNPPAARSSPTPRSSRGIGAPSARSPRPSCRRARARTWPAGKHPVGVAAQIAALQQRVHVGGARQQVGLARRRRRSRRGDHRLDVGARVRPRRARRCRDEPRPVQRVPAATSRTAVGDRAGAPPTTPPASAAVSVWAAEFGGDASQARASRLRHAAGPHHWQHRCLRLVAAIPRPGWNTGGMP